MGYSLATIGVCTVIYGAFLVKPLVAKLGERGAMTIGLIGGPSATPCSAFQKPASSSGCGIPLLNMMSFTWPAAQSLLSRKTSPSEQGQLQGAINSLRGIAGLGGPSFFTYIFSVSISSGIHIPGTPFYTAATMLVIALLLTQRVTRQPQAAI